MYCLWIRHINSPHLLQCHSYSISLCNVVLALGLFKDVIALILVLVLSIFAVLDGFLFNYIRTE